MKQMEAPNCEKTGTVHPILAQNEPNNTNMGPKHARSLHTQKNRASALKINVKIFCVDRKICCTMFQTCPKLLGHE